MKGEMNPMYGVRGSDHPSFGIDPGNVVPVYIYNAKDITLFQTFPSIAKAGRFFNVDKSTISRHAKSGKILINQYIVSTKSIN